MCDKIIVEYNSTMYNIDELFTVNMVMDIFGVSRVTVYNWLGKREGDSYPNGKFPNAFKYIENNKIYIPQSDVEKLVDKTKVYPDFNK